MLWYKTVHKRWRFAHMHWSYIIVQALSSERLQGFKLRPSLPPRQALTPPLPLWRGLWPSRDRHSLGLGSALPPSCRYQSHKLSRAEVRWRHWRGWQWGGGEYMATSQPIVYTLSLSHSLTSSHTPPPSSLTCSSFILQLTDSLLHTFSSRLHTPVFLSLCWSCNYTSKQTVQAEFNKVNFTQIQPRHLLWDEKFNRLSNYTSNKENEYLLSLKTGAKTTVNPFNLL